MMLIALCPLIALTLVWMVQRSARRALVAGLGLVAYCTVPAHADELPGKWLEIRSPNFTILSNASPRQALKTARHFEQIRQLFAQSQSTLTAESEPPLLVFAVSDERTMKRLAPWMWESRSSSRPAGFFWRSPTLTQVVIRADLVGGENFRIVYHEYFHYLVHHLGWSLPVWVDEGLAEFWGNSRMTSKAAEIGRPNKNYLELLHGNNLLPLPLLMGVDHGSPYYRDAAKKSWFYAQSWALTHYLMLGDRSGEGKQQLYEYLRLLAEDTVTEPAARQAFGDLEKLQRGLQRYVRKLLFHYAKMPVPEPISDDELQTRRISKAHASAFAARFLMDDRRTNDAEDLIALAMDEAPELAQTHEAAALLNLFRGDYTEATSAFEQALHRDVMRPLPHYGLAVIRLHSDRSADSLLEAEQRLEQALALDPDFLPALVRLAEIYCLSGAVDRAMEHIQRARALEPSSTFYRLKEAQIAAVDDIEAAETAVAEIAAELAATESGGDNNSVCWQGSLAGFARVVLPACDRAVEIGPENSSWLDSRGVARALTGNLDGALADLRKALELASDRWSEGQLAKRAAWVASLEDGINPFADEGFQQLQEDPDEAGLGWLR